VATTQGGRKLDVDAFIASIERLERLVNDQAKLIEQDELL
jgi:hypothetical protein